MPLPPEIDKKIREQLAEIWEDVSKGNENTEGYFRIKTRLQNLLYYLSNDNQRFSTLISEMNKWNANYDILAGYVEAIKKDYESGMFDSIVENIETNVNVDYMHIAEQVFQDNTTGNPIDSYVPAGILAGAVLENALRTLCQRKGIDILNDKGSYKTLNSLITDLQQATAFSAAEGDILRGYAKMRNELAHGHFGNVTRQQVEKMINEVKEFIAKRL